MANQISLSAAPPWLRGKLRIALASWGRNSPWTRSSIQLEFSSSIKAQTRALFEKFLRGEIMQPACGVGSHLSFPRLHGHAIFGVMSVSDAPDSGVRQCLFFFFFFFDSPTRRRHGSDAAQTRCRRGSDASDTPAVKKKKKKRKNTDFDRWTYLFR